MSSSWRRRGLLLLEHLTRPVGVALAVLETRGKWSFYALDREAAQRALEAFRDLFKA